MDRREREIRQTLRKLARQRVALVLQPEDVWVIELAVDDDESTQEALRTCHLRGWVEPIHDALPKGKLTPDGRLPSGEMFSGEGPLYRLTEGGWAVVNRSHQWVVMAIAVALASLVASVVGILWSRL